MLSATVGRALSVIRVVMGNTTLWGPKTTRVVYETCPLSTLTTQVGGTIQVFEILTINYVGNLPFFTWDIDIMR